MIDRKYILTEKKARRTVAAIIDTNVQSLVLSMTTSHISSLKNQNLIEFNCLGAIFLIRETSLDRFPNTLLGDPKRRTSFYSKVKQQYIIDRHIISFEAIINYYETGKLVVPTIYEPIIFFEELKYFQLDNETIEHCYDTEIKQELINHYHHDHRIVPENPILRAIWISLEYNDYSLKAQVIQLNCLIISLLFCLNISIELIPQISRDKVICHKLSIKHDSTNCDNTFFDFRPSKTVGSRILIIEQLCTTLIAFEYIFRLISSPHKWITFILLINLCDLFTLCINWIYLILMNMNISNDDKQDPFFNLKLFQYLMILRLFRFFRLCRYVKSLRILFYGTVNAFKYILSIGFILLFFVFTFGVIIQVIEKNWDHAYVTRLEDLFNIVTISTITVGDAKRIPVSPIGKILCSILAGIGLIGISLPLPAVYRIFQSIYRLEQIDRKFVTTKYVYPNGQLFKNQLLKE
ncbi:unnamed protein product [Rotaria magnacalcarata]|uniref:Uncharacterized protein n=1 Tax=Rotaria magnacalcarata TaxID=392030 RepID=A0A816LUT5_9BILA|nr:unnamed protein product [Rotaria magnacalcarata]CAF1205805.1 unnamed protein product [Rotaria magnacalcarata]CAF1928048.1 unnamed protein product [Rotaria magnacalcarata]CAF1956727.1 unnamed protein product [Rotaria magnacalcarata]CAF3748581.1 unnamed protein product [Rotaria magnacalcarata]